MLQGLQCSGVMVLSSAVVLSLHKCICACGLVFLSQCLSHFWIFCPFHCISCPLDAQHLTAALVAVEDLDLKLGQSSTEAVDKILFIPTLRQLTLTVVSNCACEPSVHCQSPSCSWCLVHPHSSLGAVGHVVSTFSSQSSFNDFQTSPCPRSVSSVSKLDLDLPPEGDAYLARWIPNCPQLEELRVNCGGKGEEELHIMFTCTDHILIPYSGKFWIGANFRLFCMMAHHMKINATKSFAF